MFFENQIIINVIQQSRTYHSQRNLKCPELNETLLMNFMGYLMYSGCINMPGMAFYWQGPTRQDLVANNFTSLEMKWVRARIHFAGNPNATRAALSIQDGPLCAAGEQQDPGSRQRGTICCHC